MSISHIAVSGDGTWLEQPLTVISIEMNEEQQENNNQII